MSPQGTPSQTAGPLEIRRVRLDSLHPDPANVRLHDERNLDAIKGSLARFGQQKPIVVDAEFVREHRGKPGYALVDGRSASFYDGVETGGAHGQEHKTGHIAGAGSFPFTEITGDDLVVRTPGELADRFTGLPLTVLSPGEPEPGWTGKLWALRHGIARARRGCPEPDDPPAGGHHEHGGPAYLLLTDADIAHEPDSLRRLVAAAETTGLDLVSQMARLRVATVRPSGETATLSTSPVWPS